MSFWQAWKEVGTMRRILTGLLIVLVLLVVGVGALGYSWFTVAKSDEDKKIPIEVKVD